MKKLLVLSLTLLALSSCKKDYIEPFKIGNKYYLNGNITYSDLKQGGIQALPPFIAQSEYYSPVQGHGYVCLDSNTQALTWQIPVNDLKSE